MSQSASLQGQWLGTFVARGILVVLMFVTLLPFITMFSAALAPSGTYPPGLQWPSDPQWGNFVEAFQSANLESVTQPAK